MGHTPFSGFNAGGTQFIYYHDTGNGSALRESGYPLLTALRVEMGQYHFFDFDTISIRYLENIPISISISIFSK